MMYKYILVIVCFLVTSCSNVDRDLKMEDRILRYDNYKQKRVLLFNLSKVVITKGQLIDITKTIEDFKGGVVVDEVLKDNLFQQGLINGWNYVETILNDTTGGIKYYEKDFAVRMYNETIEEIKASTNFYDLGQVNLSDQFESHLIVSEYICTAHQYSRSKILYILNIARNQIRSITMIASDFYDGNGFGTLLSIQKLKNGVFLLKNEITSVM